jgi:hypothetical protein
MSKTVHFLAGLPRSGSTVLSSLLSQHPQIHSTTTSGLIDLMGALCMAWESSPAVHTQKTDKDEAYALLKSVMDTKYQGTTKPIVVDKSRGWANPQIMNTLEKVIGQKPKIISTVRHPADCAASFVRLANPQDLQGFLSNSQLVEHLKNSYATLYNGYKENPDCFLFVDYDDLLSHPQAQMDRIHAFLGVEPHTYNFNSLDTQVVAERDDEVWGIPNLHKIGSRLERQHSRTAREILGYHYDNYDPPKFWKGESFENVKPKKIDRSVRLSMQGKAKQAYKLICEAHKENPVCNKIAFNMGWFALGQNRLQEGMAYLSRGRYERCFGNPKPPVPTQIWDGKSMGTILYYLEGGLGDQIHALRYIKDINRRGCDVIVACSPELFPVVRCCEGVKTIVQHEAAGGVYHDWWVPAMSVLLPLGYEYPDISGKPYIPRISVPKNGKKPTIGIRWWGNPKFEHEQNRRFPLKPFFKAFEGIDADFVCLQRDEGADEAPPWMRRVRLDSWEDTRAELSKCDLVVSSCTSIAHMSGAMGIDTWIIVPVLHYYLWAVPGNQTPYYDSVRLFRQTKYGSWSAPMSELKTELNARYSKKETENGKLLGAC